MLPLFTPANCTDCTSPVDHHVGNFIQNHMKASYLKEVETNPHIWFLACDPDHVGVAENIEDVSSNSAMHRRILMAKWLEAAWVDLIFNNRHIIHNAFVETGFLLAKDGSEDDLLKLQGWSPTEPYRFR